MASKRDMTKVAKLIIDEVIEYDRWESYNISDDEPLEAMFLGTVFNILPSGKYYTPWAHGNVTKREADQDEFFMDVLETEATKRGCFIFSGEGDPCDLFIGRSVA